MSSWPGLPASSPSAFPARRLSGLSADTAGPDSAPLGSQAFVGKVGVVVDRNLQKKNPGGKVREGRYNYGVP